MGPAYWGLLTSVTWGMADFIGRFTGRAMGHITALVGVFLMSAVAMTALSLVSALTSSRLADTRLTILFVQRET
jgi:uncharacterized membrane protein